MKRSTKFKINLAFIIVCVIVISISLTNLFLANNTTSTIDVTRWFLLSMLALLGIAFNLSAILNYTEIIYYEKQVKKMLTLEYSEVKISDASCVPFPVEIALKENNITFYAKYRETKNDTVIVCIIAKRNGQFFAEELLTEKGPMFMNCNDFLNTFKK